MIREKSFALRWGGGGGGRLAGVGILSRAALICSVVIYHHRELTKVDGAQEISGQEVAHILYRRQWSMCAIPL